MLLVKLLKVKQDIYGLGLTIDKIGHIWLGTTDEISIFDGKKFTPFLLPDTKVESPKPMLSDKLGFKFLNTT